MVKIELIGDGNGSVMLFVNGQPVDDFFCEYSLSSKLKGLLAEYLCKYKPVQTEEDE